MYKFVITFFKDTRNFPIVIQVANIQYNPPLPAMQVRYFKARQVLRLPFHLTTSLS